MNGAVCSTGHSDTGTIRRERCTPIRIRIKVEPSEFRTASLQRVEGRNDLLLAIFRQLCDCAQLRWRSRTRNHAPGWASRIKEHLGSTPRYRNSHNWSRRCRVYICGLIYEVKKPPTVRRNVRF